MRISRTLWFGLMAATMFYSNTKVKDDLFSGGIHLRYNQAGYRIDDPKIAIVLSNAEVIDRFEVISAKNEKVVFEGDLKKSGKPGWGRFSSTYYLDFSAWTEPGRYYLKLKKNGNLSGSFSIDTGPFENYHEELLGFMRQQRCGYNPFLDMVCHQKDGRTFYGPMPDSTFIDVSGGWHDAGDQLKYLITSSNATARMILAYELEPDKFTDHYDRMGHPEANGIPDVLDEARWGLDWIHKMHPGENLLFHQVADDRDHLGWKWPDEDNSDYGWGPNSYRAVYFANGKSQGLNRYKSQATGIANIAGRSAAAMASASSIWRKNLNDPIYADKCLRAAIELYNLGKENEGYQQGNSYGAPYRYNEDTWTDDMEWAAAELYKATGIQSYLEEAKQYAIQAGTTSWMELDSAAHYQFYPFVNVGHFVLYPLVNEEFQDKLTDFYKSGIEKIKNRAEQNSYNVGVPFIWCSNNLVSALITQILLYENMCGDAQYHGLMISHLDWLLGRNPWGTSMFTGIPANGEYPREVHTSIWALSRKEVSGGLVDGPVWNSIFENLAGLTLTEPDEFKEFQSEYIVYHDDLGDYSTNEPTMDGTAGAVYFMAHFAGSIRNQ